MSGRRGRPCCRCSAIAKITRPTQIATQQLPGRLEAAPVDDQVAPTTNADRAQHLGSRQRGRAARDRGRAGAARRATTGANAYMIAVADVTSPTSDCQLGNGRNAISPMTNASDDRRHRHAALADLGQLRRQHAPPRRARRTAARTCRRRPGRCRPGEITASTYSRIVASQLGAGRDRERVRTGRSRPCRPGSPSRATRLRRVERRR